jgi:hypothetical protein
MWPFRRRAKGRHALGAAVTDIPGMRVPAPVAVPVQVEPVRPPEPAPTPAPVQVPAATPMPTAAGPRVELGFRDGSTAALAPGSEQARALTDIASMLTTRD